MRLGILLLLLWPRTAAARNVDTSDASEFVDGDRPLLRLNYDNDYFAGTDRFYTDGIGVDFYHPALRHSPLMRPLFALPGGVRSYGLAFRHSCFTPTHLDTPRPLYRDRPYAAYVLLSHVLVSKDEARGLVLTTELDAGMIGEGIGGGYAQAWFHRYVAHGIPPQGWANQIRNDVALDYYARLEKKVQATEHEDLSISGDATAGTLYDNASVGAAVRFGFIRPARDRFFFFADAEAKEVAYDATLQGGMTNRSTAYTLNTNSIKRLVVRETLGAALAWRDWTIEFRRVFMTPEFVDDLNMQWGEVTIMKQF